MKKSGEIWLGRALVVAAAPAALAHALESGQLPAFLKPGKTLRRLAVHLRIQPGCIPEGMCSRVILLGEPPGEPLITLGRIPSAALGRGPVDFVARVVVGPDADLEREAVAIAIRVRELLPFSEGGVELLPLQLPSWDDDDWLEDPSDGSGWPMEAELRVSSRPAVYRLDRARVAGLGTEGDLLLGWRAGDAVAAELA